MVLVEWDKLPENMKNESVKYYYDILSKKKYSLLGKRIFDLTLALLLFIFFILLFIGISIAIILDSKGPIFYRQIRVTQFGKHFSIYKFRTMVDNADKIGSHITINNDPRVTRVGRILRKFRLDEIPQLLNIIKGEMSFVGTRPEVVKYVDHYSDAMLATLLLPAGVTSEASIVFKDEERILSNSTNIDQTYISEILPRKMEINLKNIENFSLSSDFKIIFKTLIAVIKR